MAGSRDRTRNEEGALLIVIMIGVAVASIGLAAAVQAWSTTWRRDNEEELIFRGKQYVNAILAYRKEHGGQFPLNLEDLYKPGPRRLRYIRKLFKDPIVKGGKWGLLYLAPGGQTVYDPKAAQKASAKAGASGPDTGDGGEDSRPTSGGWPAPSGRNGGFGGAGGGFGGPGGGFGNNGQMPGAPQPGGMQPMLQPPPIGTWTGNGKDDEERISEPPLGWPIVGVISRAEGKVAEKTFMTYKGHDEVDDWQFNALEVEGMPPQIPPNAQNARPNGGFGPGYGGRSQFGGITAGGRQGPQP